MVFFGKMKNDKKKLIEPQVSDGSSSANTETGLLQDTDNDSTSRSSSSSWESVSPPVVKIAGIDNGLAFPFKHPDQWRSYPYGWISLPQAKEPFSQSTCDEFLPLLSNPSNWDDLIDKLRSVFMRDAEFVDGVFRNQMAILRGQLHNLCEALQKRQSPLELVRKPLLLIEEEDDYYKERDEDSEGALNVRRKLKTFVKAQPCFSWC